MKVSIAAHHLPHPEGTATGRTLHAAAEGLLALGHEVDVWSWGADPPHREAPPWCRWEPLPHQRWISMKVRALVAPRRDPAVSGWHPAPGAIPVADDPVSFAAVEPFEGAVLTQHYLTRLDAPALGRWTLRDLQDRRAERRNFRRADRLVAYSERVAAHMPPSTTVIPLPYRAPSEPVAFVEEPVAAMLADWRWPPNLAALDHLLTSWPDVCSQVPHARLLVAGRHLPAIGQMEGVEIVGEYDTVSDVLARSAVLAFPCPPTSGPKVKVIEALAFGVAVVTTDAGSEGIFGSGAGCSTGALSTFGPRLARALADPVGRSALATAARATILEYHDVLPAARHRAAALGLGGARD